MPAVRDGLVGVARSGLNAARHSGSPTVQVTLLHRRLMVRDDGAASTRRTGVLVVSGSPACANVPMPWGGADYHVRSGERDVRGDDLVTAPRIKVLVADDHAPTRAGVRASLDAEGFEVIGEASNARAVVGLAVEFDRTSC